jgi:hypothetical protein
MTEESKTVNVVTTAPGVWGVDGVIPVGTRMEVPVEAFSANWMKPADIGASQRLKAAAKKA